MDMNRVMLIWRVSSDVRVNEIKEWTTKVANFNLAINRRFKNSKWEVIDEAEFVKCVAYSKLAEIVEIKLKKGQKTFAEWRLKTRSYEDKEWVTRYVTEVILSDIKVC